MNPTEYENLRRFLTGLASGQFDPALTPLLAEMALQTLERSQQQADTEAAGNIAYLRDKLAGN